MAHDLITDLVSATHHGADDGMRAFPLMLHGLVQQRVERIAFIAESRKPKTLKGSRELVGHRLQGTGLQVSVVAGAIEVVEHGQQLSDYRGLGPLGDQLLVAHRTLAVVVVLRFDALQGRFQFSDLVGVRSRGGFRSRPGRLLTNFASFGIDTPFVGDGHRLVRIVLAHLFSRSSSTTSASTTSSAEDPAGPPSEPPLAAWSAC